MMRPLRYALAAIQLPFLIRKLLGFIEYQKAYIKKNIGPVLNEAMRSNDGSLDEKDLKKITGYYGLAVAAILGEAFCALRGNPMAQQERWASTCQGAMTGLFDDFFDKDHMDDIAIKGKLHDPEQGKRSNEKLFDHFYRQALENVPDSNLMRRVLHDVYLAQVDSKEQNHSIERQRMISITLNKGGVSLQFYRTAFSHPCPEEENMFFYQAGGLMQIANDIFDVYKDSKANIRTIVTTAVHISEVRDYFKASLLQLQASACRLPYNKKNIEQFLDIISIGIFSRCFVCLDHLEKSEERFGIFRPNECTRQELICDMDTKKNMLRSAAYHLKYKM